MTTTAVQVGSPRGQLTSTTASHSSVCAQSPAASATRIGAASRTQPTACSGVTPSTQEMVTNGGSGTPVSPLSSVPSSPSMPPATASEASQALPDAEKGR
jgi:hypothetical protein